MIKKKNLKTKIKKSAKKKVKKVSRKNTNVHAYGKTSSAKFR